jgi:alkanesulfonate monooxygenase SsuD/methylene tetrahydromethanopterin reductase-like flavin-dependent oxidoreductase (luciferase family)
MKLGDFLFTECLDPAKDREMIEETKQEALLAEELGMDAIWIAEHHFDGNCAYVDPIGFAAMLVGLTKRVRIGFAVLQASLHHPVRLAEQISLLDNLSQGRMMVGLGRGTQFNAYEYEGFQANPAEAQARLEETEEILLKGWSGEAVAHTGKYWNLKFPMLRPRPFTKPHPLLLRSVSNNADSVAEQARKGRPFLLGTLQEEFLVDRLNLARNAMREVGYDEEKIGRTIDECWAWRNVTVAETDEKAIALGLTAYREMIDYRTAISPSFAQFMAKFDRLRMPDGLICGTPATVFGHFRALKATGIGGAIIRFRIGMLPHEAVMNSVRLFATEVAPALRKL